MRSYLDLIPISARVCRRQSRLTRCCIAISVFLVTAVFGMAERGFRMEADRLSAKHGPIGLASLLASGMGQTLIVTALVLFVLILMAGALMIAGSINSQVAQRTRFFGMMRCIGMSGRQMKRFVRLEALNWCRTAIPIGLAAGTAFTWAASAVLRFVVGEEFTNLSVWTVSIPGIVGGTAVGIIAVLLAANAPAKRAANISPVAAVSGAGNISESDPVQIGNSVLSIETRLGIAHAAGMKKNMLLMAGSLALSIVLFLSFLVLTDFVSLLVPQSRSDADIMITSKAKENDLPSALAERLAAGQGILHVYSRQSLLDIDADVRLGSFAADKVDMISFDDYELSCLAKDHQLQRGSDVSKVYGDSAYALATWDPYSPLHIGDAISIGSETLHIAGLLKNDPFYEDGMTHGKVTLIPSRETFTRLTGVTDVRMIQIQLTSSAGDADIEAIYAAVNDVGIVTDQREESTKGTYMAFMLFVYGFLAIIALVALLNIMSSLSMSVSARMKQYGAMRAVGMSGRQVTKMIAAEAATYALGGSVFGSAAGIVINRMLYRTLIEDHFAYVTWHLPAVPLLIVLLFIAFAVTLAVRSPAARIRRMAITETLKEP